MRSNCWRSLTSPASLLGLDQRAPDAQRQGTEARGLAGEVLARARRHRPRRAGWRRDPRCGGPRRRRDRRRTCCSTRSRPSPARRGRPRARAGPGRSEARSSAAAATGRAARRRGGRRGRAARRGPCGRVGPGATRRGWRVSGCWWAGPRVWAVQLRSSSDAVRASSQTHERRAGAWRRAGSSGPAPAGRRTPRGRCRAASGPRPGRRRRRPRAAARCGAPPRRPAAARPCVEDLVEHPPAELPGWQHAAAPLALGDEIAAAGPASRSPSTRSPTAHWARLSISTGRGPRAAPRRRGARRRAVAGAGTP